MIFVAWVLLAAGAGLFARMMLRLFAGRGLSGWMFWMSLSSLLAAIVAFYVAGVGQA